MSSVAWGKRRRPGSGFRFLGGEEVENEGEEVRKGGKRRADLAAETGSKTVVAP